MAKTKDTQTRKWQITINNPKQKNFSHDEIKVILAEMKSLIYWCMADEIGEKETYHTHLYLHFKSPMRFSTLKNKFPGAHFEMAKGSASANKDYIFKQGKWADDKKADTAIPETQEEYGEFPIERQGQRNDLIDLYDMIKEGKSNFDILEENSDYLFDIEKIEKARQVIREEQFKNEFRNVVATYIYGDTGTGKTRDVMEKYGYSNVFRVTDYSHPFDSYKGQDVVVFEEFRGQLKISEMLNYLDGYPLELPARYSNRVACFTKVYIISNEPLKTLYQGVQRNSPETFNALVRRIPKIKIYEGKQKITLDTSDYLQTDDYKYFRTDGEIENILNLVYYQKEKEHSGQEVLFGKLN